MKSFKMNGFNKLLVFLMIVIILICLVGFAANGWQSPNENKSDSGDVGENTDQTDGNKDDEGNKTPTDENQSGENREEEIIEIPKYYNTITGLEISADQLSSTPLGFVINSDSPLYGISDSDVVFEIPTEKSSTRFVAYTTNKNMLWKVGTLAPTRAFISSLSNLFGGLIISYKNDDIVKYNALDVSGTTLDLSKFSGSYYVENSNYIYTSADLVSGAMINTDSLKLSVYKSPPYVLSGETVIGTTRANTIILPYSDLSETEFYYSQDTKEYTLYKSGIKKNDMLTGKSASFTNVFILFANSTTYENADGKELVMDITSGGSGYYISNGYLTEFRWSVDENGSLIFKNLNGETLSVNKGNSYIGYFKSSSSSLVTVG